VKKENALSDRLEESAKEPEFEFTEWRELDREVLRAALHETHVGSDEWWQKYKKTTRHQGDRKINSASYVSAKLDDRWGSEFSVTGWRTVEHLQQQTENYESSD
jgi:hypothetical protein